MRRNAGFTLVEILIVVIILGILAAIVIPQFTEASNEARVSSMTSDLQTVRSQIELYKIQHSDRSPNEQAVVTDGITFWAQLTSKTNVDGVTGQADSIFGPYLQMLPKNPFVTSGAEQSSDLFIGGWAGAGATDGWCFDTDDNQFKALGQDPDDEDNATKY